jgi:hypothetical protein
MMRFLVITFFALQCTHDVIAQNFYNADTLKLTISEPKDTQMVPARLNTTVSNYAEYLPVTYAKTNVQLVSFQSTDKRRKAQCYLGFGNVRSVKAGAELYTKNAALQKIAFDVDAARSNQQGQSHQSIAATAFGKLTMGQVNTTYELNASRVRVYPFGLLDITTTTTPNIPKLVNLGVAVKSKTTYSARQDSFIDNYTKASMAIINQNAATEFSTDFRIPYVLNVKPSKFQIQPNIIAQVKSANTANALLYQAYNLGFGMRVGELSTASPQQYFVGFNLIAQNGTTYFLPDCAYIRKGAKGQQFAAGIKGNSSVNSANQIMQSMPFFSMQSNAPSTVNIDVYANYAFALNKASNVSVGLTASKWNTIVQIHNTSADSPTLNQVQLIAINLQEDFNSTTNVQLQASYNYLLTDALQVGLSAQSRIFAQQAFAINMPLYHANAFLSYTHKGWHLKPIVQLRGTMRDYALSANGIILNEYKVPAMLDLSFATEKTIKNNWHAGITAANILNSNYQLLVGYNNYGFRALLHLRKDLY